MRSRKEFERNMHILSEEIRNNQISFNWENTKRARKSISNVKYSPNLRANLNTVDESARSVANHSANILDYHNRNKNSLVGED